MSPNIRSPKYVRQILTEPKGEIKKQYNNNRGLYYLTCNNRQIIQKKTNKKTVDLNNAIDHMSLTDIYRQNTHDF